MIRYDELTARGRTVVAFASLTVFLLILGFCGWLEGL